MVVNCWKLTVPLISKMKIMFKKLATFFRPHLFQIVVQTIFNYTLRYLKLFDLKIASTNFDFSRSLHSKFVVRTYTNEVLTIGVVESLKSVSYRSESSAFIYIGFLRMLHYFRSHSFPIAIQTIFLQIERVLT